MEKYIIKEIVWNNIKYIQPQEELLCLIGGPNKIHLAKTIKINENIFWETIFPINDKKYASTEDFPYWAEIEYPIGDTIPRSIPGTYIQRQKNK